MPFSTYSNESNGIASPVYEIFVVFISDGIVMRFQPEGNARIMVTWNYQSPVTKALCRAFAVAGIYPVALTSTQVYAAIARDDAPEALRLLENCPAALEPVSPEQVPPFHIAVLHDKAESMKAIASRYPHVLTGKDGKGRPFLLRAVTRDFKGAQITALLGAGADIHAQDDAGNTALHLAAAGKAPQGIVKALIAGGAVIDARNGKGETPLMLAVVDGKNTEEILRAGANINALDHKGLNATMHAIRRSALETASDLISKGGQVDLNDPMVDIALRVATSEMNVPFLKAIGALHALKEEQQREDVNALVSSIEAGTAREMQVKQIRLKKRTP